MLAQIIITFWLLDQAMEFESLKGFALVGETEFLCDCFARCASEFTARR